MKMMNGLKLTIIHFDSMENRDPIHTEELGIFMDSTPDEPYKTAYTKIEEYLRDKEARPVYLGWDYQVYPQYRVEKVKIS
jgi:hypothetical protein